LLVPGLAAISAARQTWHVPTSSIALSIVFTRFPCENDQ